MPKPLLKITYCFSRCKCSTEPVDHAIYVQESDRNFVKILFICLECGSVATSHAKMCEMDKFARGVMGHPKNQWEIQ